MDDLHSAYGTLIESRIRVLSWNLWWQFGPWQARRRAITTAIRAIDADVICLQEVWEDASGCFAAELAGAMGFHHVYGYRLDLDEVKFGNAVLSRWPITAHEVLPLPAPADADELRTCVRADIDGPRGSVQAYSTHLNWRFDHSHIRQDQVRAVCAFIARSRSGGGHAFPPVLCGDFNAVPDSDEVRMLTGRMATPEPKLVFHDAWEVAGSGGDGFTWTNTNPYAALDLEPDRRIDYVFAGWPKDGGAGHVTSCRVVGADPVDGVVPSDHLGVLAELRY